MIVADTGNARAAGDSTAVTGYRGPVPETSNAPDAPVHLSGTGEATAANGAIANTGHLSIGTLALQRASQEPASWPHQVGVIPSAARSFQQRAEADRLRATLQHDGTVVLTQLLTGMGGVGKTQLAADYARAAWNDTSSSGGLDVLVWITASARSPIVTGYAQAGVELCRADSGDPERAASAFLAWLTPKAEADPCRWLIVLDDVADPADLRGLWPPVSPHGRTLVTTRRRDAALVGSGRHTIEVGLFTPEEALTYLATSLAGRDESADELAALAEDLGRLPLALAQASAYLIDTDETVAGYRDLLVGRTASLSDTAPDALPDDQTLPLAAAWSLSIDRADTLRPAGLARPMLHLASLLDANGIPETVLTSPPALSHLAAHRPRTGTGPAEEPAPISARDAVHALRALHRLSLIHHSPATPHQAVRVHQLIQRAVRDTLTPDEYHQTARTVADALFVVWPSVENDATLAQTLRANTSALVSSAEGALYQPGAHAVLFRSGASLSNTGQAAAARDYYQHLTDTIRGHLGPDHRHTIVARTYSALWRGHAGDAAGAAADYAVLHDDAVRVLGEDHRGIIQIRHELARWRGDAGDAAAAVTDLVQLLKDLEDTLGPDHPDTLIGRAHLARWRGHAGELARAVADLTDLLEPMERVFGPDHIQVLSVRHNRAAFRGTAGDTTSAASDFAQLVQDQKRISGPTHYKTLNTRWLLADWLEKAGDAAGASAVYAELLADRIQVLGADHPDTFTTRNDLARAYASAGDLERAISLHEQNLTEAARALGEGHPIPVMARENLNTAITKRNGDVGAS
ncbi:tetratricopeptide repeat protein [Streptomyces canus]|uniref:tetratricopeptide repeat protein n=1 Tax=Streptomyces canus TaxID=58343 RepID=UPI00324DC13A